MKKSLLALAVLGAFAGAAQAQTNVTIYGQLDVGLSKASNATTVEQAGDNNKLGFKGTEDLGGGLAALFQAEIRFDPNTGKTEGNGARPLFQGSSVVGLSGGFGTLRLGRALTALQSTIPAFDPYGADRARGAFVPDVDLAGYNSVPLDAAGSSQNRFSNGVFYTTPSLSGFQANLSVQTKQAQDLGTPVTTPFSVAGTYANGPIGALVAYEKNAVRDSVWTVAGSYKLGTANLMATYAKLSAGDVVTGAPVAVDAKAWSLGANVDVGTGNVLAAYGEKKLDSGANSGAKTKKASLGYEHRLSKRTFLYTDLIYRKDPLVSSGDAIKTFDVGVHHNF